MNIHTQRDGLDMVCEHHVWTLYLVENDGSRYTSLATFHNHDCVNLLSEFLARWPKTPTTTEGPHDDEPTQCGHRVETVSTYGDGEGDTDGDERRDRYFYKNRKEDFLQSFENRGSRGSQSSQGALERSPSVTATAKFSEAAAMTNVIPFRAKKCRPHVIVENEPLGFRVTILETGKPPRIEVFDDAEGVDATLVFWDVWADATIDDRRRPGDGAA